MARRPQRILGSQLREITKRAVRLARAQQREVAGVLVSHGNIIWLVELTNVSRRRGSFELIRREIRVKEAAERRLGSRVVGTFHSHIAWLAKPGKTDVAGAEDGSLMLIIDTNAREQLLWRIHKRRAYKLAFEVV